MAFALVWANLVAALAAVVANVWRWRHSRSEHRWVCPVIAVTAAVFAASYLWVLVDYPRRVASWTPVMNGMALFAWVVVWIVAPIVATAPPLTKAATRDAVNQLTKAAGE